MRRIIVTGCGTTVGKTVVSACLTRALEGDYWKPVVSGTEEECDYETMKALLNGSDCHVHESSYRLRAALSPHHAAKLEGVHIDPAAIICPITTRPLIIETSGGIFVPLNDELLAIDFFQKWDALWVIVSRNYLGSINHTLLTIEALQKRNVDIRLLIFNGHEVTESERAISFFSAIKNSIRLEEYKQITVKTIQECAEQWKRKEVWKLLV